MLIDMRFLNYQLLNMANIVDDFMELYDSFSQLARLKKSNSKNPKISKLAN